MTEEIILKKYLRRVRRRLSLPRDVRDRVMNDFSTSVAARLENGQSLDAVMAELGAPEKAAADLNEQMKEYAYRKSPWRFLFLSAAIVSGAKLAYEVIVTFIAQLLLRHAAILSGGDAAVIGVIGGADGPTSIFITTPDWLRNGIPILILIIGVLGYYFLSHRKK